MTHFCTILAGLITWAGGVFGSGVVRAIGKKLLDVAGEAAKGRFFSGKHSKEFKYILGPDGQVVSRVEIKFTGRSV